MPLLTVKQFSYVFLAGFVLIVGVFNLSVPFLAVLFSLVVLNSLLILRNRWLAALAFVVLVSGLTYVTVIVGREASHTLPVIMARSVPIVIGHLKQWGVELPFQDVEGLRAVISESLQEEISSIARAAGLATKEFLLFIIALVIAISMFLSRTVDMSRDQYQVRPNLYMLLTDEIQARLSGFFLSFQTVMGAQLAISVINTFFTGIFLFAEGLPYAHILVATTFVCGLLPILGNLMSNTIIFTVAITQSVNDAIFALMFLVVLHKMEYFLNGKIIGGRIGNPMWLTLIALIVGEQLMGIPGIILAPVVLFYIKQECSKIPVTASQLP